MIIVTGAAGFIGSCIVKELNAKGRTDIIIVDSLDKTDKWKNLVGLKYQDYIDRDHFFEALDLLDNIDIIIHMGAITENTEKDTRLLMENNFKFSKRLFDWCVNKRVRFMYASSAATYGDGRLGYSDEKTDDLVPISMYGYTKKLFDQYVLSRKAPPQVVGFRFFNVYGPNEYHKGTPASMVFHWFNQVKKDKKVRMFKSYRKGFKDGEQKRDFVYIKDAVSVIMFMYDNKQVNGIFNVGTGKARTFKDLAKAVFKALRVKPTIELIEMPESLKATYQYFTQADINKLRKVGYKGKFHSLEEGVRDYVVNYMDKDFKHI